MHLDLLYPSLYNCKFILKLRTQWDNVVPTSSLWTVKCGKSIESYIMLFMCMRTYFCESYTNCIMFTLDSVPLSQVLCGHCDLRCVYVFAQCWGYSFSLTCEECEDECFSVLGGGGGVLGGQN